MKKILIYILIVTFQIGSFPGISLAQDATPSAGFSETLINPPATSSAETNGPTVSFSDFQTPGASLKIEPRMFVEGLSKLNFQVKEKVEVVVKNSEGKKVKLEIGEGTFNGIIEKTIANGDTVFSIYPAANFKPGKYTVRVIDEETNTIISEQDFTWGVLAINTHKSIYAPGESANIAIAVLDEAGRMVCDATVDLEITDPNFQKITLSTRNGAIKVNRDCLLHQVTEHPDYETNYQTVGVGRYQMKLTATTLDDSHTITDRFEVREFVPFDVERVTATRVYPPEEYPVVMKIKANEAFKGKIVESVPSEFQIYQIDRDGVYNFAQENSVPQKPNLNDGFGIPKLSLPFEGEYPVSLGFGQQMRNHDDTNVYKKAGLDGHDGIDFALPDGTPTLSVDEGNIILAKENWIYGTSVVIQHAWGRSYYGHMGKIEVEIGQFISKGQQIGLSGHTGIATGPHLHFGLKPNNYDINNLYYGKIDPAPYFGISSEDPVLSTSNYPISTKALVWNVEIEKGAEFAIGYKYKAPLRSPDFYTLGPLQFITSQIQAKPQAKFDVNPFVLGVATNSGVLIESSSSSGELNPQISQLEIPTQESLVKEEEQVIFAEIRPWQLAIDVDSTIILDNNADGTCGSGCWTVPSDWTDVNTIRAIGGGGAGDNLTTGGGGGGGGAYASITNLNLTAGNNITFGVGAGGTDAVNGGISWFNAASAAACTSSTTCVKGAGGTTATNATGGAGGTTAASIGTTLFAGGAGGNGSATGDDSTGGGGGAGSPNGTGGTGGGGDTATGGDEAMGGGGGSGCDSIGTANDGVQGGANGGAGGDSCFASGGTGGISAIGNPGIDGSGGGGGDTAQSGGNGGNGISTSDPSLAGGGGGGGDDDGLDVGGGIGGLYGGGGGGGQTIGAGAVGVIIITYTQLVTGPTNDQLMRHGKWFNAGVEQPFTF